MVGILCAQKLTSESAAFRAAIDCHKMISFIDRMSHLILFAVTDFSFAGSISDHSNLPLNLPPLADLNNTVRIGTRF